MDEIDYYNELFGNDLELEYVETYCHISNKNDNHFQFRVSDSIMEEEHVIGNFYLFDGNDPLNYEHIIEKIGLEISGSIILNLYPETIQFYRDISNYYTNISINSNILMDKIGKRYNIPDELLDIIDSYIFKNNLYSFHKDTINYLPIYNIPVSKYHSNRLIIKFKENLNLNIKYDLFKIKNKILCKHIRSYHDSNYNCCDNFLTTKTKIFQTRLLQRTNLFEIGIDLILSNGGRTDKYQTHIIGISENIVNKIILKIYEDNGIKNIHVYLDKYYKYGDKIVSIFKLPYFIHNAFDLINNPFTKIFSIKFNILMTMSGLQGLLISGFY